MKILVIAPTPYFSDRGCHVRIYEECRVLSDAGHEITLCTYHLGKDQGSFPIARTGKVPWYKKKTAGPSWHKIYLDFFLLWKSWRVGNKFKPDIIHAHLHEGAFVSFFLKRLLKCPVVFDCQGSLAGELVDHSFVCEGSFLYKMFRSMESFLCKDVDHILVSSTSMANVLLSDFNVSAEVLTPLIDGVDVKTFKPVPSSEEVRSKYGLPKDKVIVSYLGAMTDYQGLPVLIESIEEIVRSGFNAHFLLMGYPEAEYREIVESKGLSGHVTFTGRVAYASAPELLCASDIAVSPKLSRTEANGKVFNYMACALPVVVFDTPVNREILGDTGIYADYGDAEDFTRKLKGALSEPELLKIRGLEARAKVVANDSWDSRLQIMETVYNELLSS